MKICILDIETEAIPKEGHRHIKTIWCIVVKPIGEEPIVFTEDNFDEFVQYTSGVDLWVAHNGLSFDIPVLNRIFGKVLIDSSKVIDTFVVSRLINYSRFSTHSLDELGQHLKFPKGKFNDWSKLSQEMIDYCIQDVRVTEAVYEMYKKFIFSPEWADSMKLEHQMVLVNEDMSANGFLFNTKRANELLASIKTKMSELEDKFQKVWPPELQEVNRIQFRQKLDGSLFKNVAEAKVRYPKTVQEGSELVCYDYVSFNPGSPDRDWETYLRVQTF